MIFVEPTPAGQLYVATQLPKSSTAWITTKPTLPTRASSKHCPLRQDSDRRFRGYHPWNRCVF